MTAALDRHDRYAAFLRCSNEELQDPNLSLVRQLHTCQATVAKWGGQIVAVYYEVETGAARYQQRGSGTDLTGFSIPIPRAGGLHELAADAARRPRLFDRVICESIDRLARNSAVAFTLEDEFRAAGVGLHCANEPFEESFGSIVLRHLNVGLARGYLFNLKKASRGGCETATREGWHMGGTPVYGYRLVPHPHPNPHKRKRGLVRHTLDLDPVRAPVVRRIFDEYLYGTRGLNEIRDLLNSDLDRYPVPVPTDPARRAATWNRSTVWYILRNPKYTGYQVWNRRANKTGRGRANPPEQWTWSDQPAHPPIVSRHEYDQVQVKAARNQRSGHAPRRDATPPQGATATADYLFRNRVVCAHCDLRMWGNRRNTTRYYLCRPAHQRGTTPPGHPRTVYVNERALMHAVTDTLAVALYGPDRATYWEHALAADPQPNPADADAGANPTDARIAELEQQVADLEARLRRQLLNLEDDDLPHQARRRITERIAELEAELTGHQASLARLRQHRQPTATPPDAPTVQALLAAFPVHGTELRSLDPTDLRELFASLNLLVRYDHARHSVRLQLTLTAVPAGQGGNFLECGLLRR